MNVHQIQKMKIRLKAVAKVFTGGTIVFLGLNIYNGNERFYRQFVMPLVHWIDPETAHKFAVKAAKYGFVPHAKIFKTDALVNDVCGLRFSNPVGVAAGFDKHCEAVSGLFKAGFSFVETGTVTPQPQDGNPKPRVFRLKEDEAIINRYGFNSVGYETFHKRLKEVLSKPVNGVIGVSLGKNKTTKNAAEDYVHGIQLFGTLPDYIAINISSPNTPGLRKLQSEEHLDGLLKMVVSARDKLGSAKKPLILLKIAPDLTENDLKSMIKVIMKNKIDGIIVCNTTIERPTSLVSMHKEESGGLSGKPLNEKSTKMIHDVYSLTEGKIPIIGVGGISTGTDAYNKIKEGASLVQLYSSMVYKGPAIANIINDELLALLESDGYKNIRDAIGSNHAKKS